jgi:FG-GAP-like repeat
MRPPIDLVLRTVAFVLAAAAVPAQSSLLQEMEEDVPRNGLYGGIYGPLGQADFDGDGDIDFLRTDGILFNDGSGRFSAPGNAPGGILACLNFAAVADFDGDGDADVVGASCPTGVPRLRLNNGNGTFTYAPVPLPLGGGVGGFIDLYVADLNGDGKPDVFGGTNFVSIFAWINLNGTTFAVVPFPPAGPWLSVLGAGDVDGDGDDDIAFVDQASPGTASGVVRVASLVVGVFVLGPALSAPAQYTYGGVGDWNADGFADLIVSSVPSVPFTSATDILRVGGPGGLGPVVATSNHPYLGYTILPFDLDGVAPLEALRAAGTGIDVVAVGVGGATPVLAPLPSWSPYLAPLLAADYDADGDADVLGYTVVERRRVLFNTPSGFVDPAGTFDATFAPGWGVFGLDVDADGDTDAVSADLSEVRSNDGRGRFSATTASAPTGPLPWASHAACVLDFDGDGREDVFCAAAGPAFPNHTLYLTAFGLTWITAVLPTPTIDGARCASGDLDQDADLDVVVVGQTNPLLPPTPTTRVDWVVNLGAGTMALQVLDATHRTMDVALADLDADGDLDVVQANLSATATPDPTVFRINQGAGVFVQTPFPPAVQARRTAAADLDGNGTVDVVLDGVAWLRNGTTWTAAPLVAGTPGGEFKSHQLADLDGDGFPELIAEAGWYAGLGATGFGTLNLWPTVSSQPPRAAFTVRDLDADGDPDVILQPAIVMWNTKRHLARGSLARIGRVGSVEILGAPFGGYQLAASLGPAAPAVAVPPWGTVMIDLASVVLLPPGTLDPLGRASFAALCPNNPALIGASLWWQAAMLSETRVTGIEETKILGL